MGVPNTGTFSLQDVVDTVNPTTDDLVDCYSDATAAYFDLRYDFYRQVNYKTLYGFRNYDNTSLLDITAVDIDNSGNMTVTCYCNFSPVYISKDNGVNWVEATINTTDATYTFTGIGAGTYYIKAKDYKQEIAWEGNPVVISAFTDWWLPSRDEMDYIHDNLYAYSVGNLGAISYWSSSEWDSDYAWYYAMDEGAAYHDEVKTAALRFRPSRKFWSSSGSLYSLRDVGPAGGYIYLILYDGSSGYDYFEAYKDDNFAYGGYTNSEDWATSYDVIGTTSTSAGEGQNNSNEIVTVVVSHATAACNNLSTLIIT